MVFVLLELFVPLHVTIILFRRYFNNVYTAYCTIIIVLTVQIMCYNMQKKYKYSEVFEEWVNILDSFTEMVEIFRFKYEFKSIYMRKMHKNPVKIRLFKLISLNHRILQLKFFTFYIYFREVFYDSGKYSYKCDKTCSGNP